MTIVRMASGAASQSRTAIAKRRMRMALTTAMQQMPKLQMAARIAESDQGVRLTVPVNLCQRVCGGLLAADRAARHSSWHG